MEMLEESNDFTNSNSKPLSKSILLLYSFTRFTLNFFAFWSILIPGVVIFYFVSKIRRKKQADTILLENGVNEYERVRSLLRERTIYRSVHGLFISRHNYEELTRMYNYGLFIIPKRNESALKALLRYIPSLKDLQCDIFVYNKPFRKYGSVTKNFKHLRDLTEAYSYFLLKTDMFYHENVIILTDAKSFDLANALTTQFPTAGILVDFTRQRRNYNKLVDTVDSQGSLSLVNLVAKYYTFSANSSLIVPNANEFITPLMIVSHKVGRLKRTSYLQCRVGMVKQVLIKKATRIKAIRYPEEFRETVLSFFHENKGKRSNFTQN